MSKLENASSENRVLSLGSRLGVAVRREQGGGRGRERRGGRAAPPRHSEARGQGGDCGHASC